MQIPIKLAARKTDVAGDRVVRLAQNVAAAQHGEAAPLLLLFRRELVDDLPNDGIERGA